MHSEHHALHAAIEHEDFLQDEEDMLPEEIERIHAYCQLAMPRFS